MSSPEKDNWSHFITGKGDMVGMKGSPNKWVTTAIPRSADQQIIDGTYWDRIDMPIRTKTGDVLLRCGNDTLSIVMQVTKRRWPRIWKRTTKMESVASVPYRIKEGDTVTLSTRLSGRQFVAKVNDKVMLRYPK